MLGNAAARRTYTSSSSLTARWLNWKAERTRFKACIGMVLSLRVVMLAYVGLQQKTSESAALVLPVACYQRSHCKWTRPCNTPYFACPRLAFDFRFRHLNAVSAKPSIREDERHRGRECSLSRLLHNSSIRGGWQASPSPRNSASASRLTVGLLLCASSSTVTLAFSRSGSCRAAICTCVEIFGDHRSRAGRHPPWRLAGFPRKLFQTMHRLRFRSMVETRPLKAHPNLGLCRVTRNRNCTLSRRCSERCATSARPRPHRSSFVVRKPTPYAQPHFSLRSGQEHEDF